MSTSICPNCSGRGSVFISQLGGGATEICCPMCGGLENVTFPGVNSGAGTVEERRGGAVSVGGYQPFQISATLESLIPLWLERLLGAVVAVALVWLAHREGMFGAVTAPVGIKWEIAVGNPLTGAIGYALGAHALKILVRLFDLSLKLARTVLILGAILGGVWLLGTILGL